MVESKSIANTGSLQMTPLAAQVLLCSCEIRLHPTLVLGAVLPSLEMMDYHDLVVIRNAGLS